MAVPVISLDKDSQCGYLTITDITTYPLNTYARSYLSILATWSTDDFVADFNIDQTDPDPGIWIIPAVNLRIYNVKLFWFFEWDSSVNIDFGPFAIVHSNGYYFIKQTAGTINPTVASPAAPHLNRTDWGILVIDEALDLTAIGGSVYAALTEEDIHDLCVYSIDTATEQMDYTTGVIEIDCPPVTITKTGCHLYTITVADDVTVTSAILQDYSGNTLESYSISETTLDIDLTTYGDGVYVFHIEYTYSAIDYEIEEPIYDMCDAYDCYTALFKYNLCACDDPCDDCDEDLMARKYDEDTIRMLISQIEKMVFLDKYRYLGVYDVSIEREDFIEEVGTMVDKLKIITDRCGLCDELDTNIIDC